MKSLLRITVICCFFLSTASMALSFNSTFYSKGQCSVAKAKNVYYKSSARHTCDLTSITWVGKLKEKSLQICADCTTSDNATKQHSCLDLSAFNITFCSPRLVDITNGNGRLLASIG